MNRQFGATGLSWPGPESMSLAGSNFVSAHELTYMMEEMLHLDIPENVYLIYGAGELAAEICRSIALSKEACARARCHESRGGGPEDTPKCGKKIYIIDAAADSARRLADSLNVEVCLCCFGLDAADPDAGRALEDAGVVIHADRPDGTPTVELRPWANFKDGAI